MTPADLRAWRERLGMTQEAAAEALDTPLQTYGSWERGRRHADRLPGVVEVACRLIEEQRTAEQGVNDG